MNFRSCARDPLRPRRSVPNHRPRLYHSGETSDFGFLVATLAAREPGVPLLAAGVSLGGNVLLKWLGENPGQTAVRARGGDLDALRPRGRCARPRARTRPSLHGVAPRDAAGEGARGRAAVSRGRGAHRRRADTPVPDLLGVRRRGHRAAPRLRRRRRLLRALELDRLRRRRSRRRRCASRRSTTRSCRRRSSSARGGRRLPRCASRSPSAAATSGSSREPRLGRRATWAEETAIAWLGGRDKRG